MKTITEHFITSIKWNAIEVCLYQIIVWVFHLTLFSILDHTFYGTIGILFSLLYMGVTVCSLGFDSALSPFMRYLTASKASFCTIVRRQCIPNIFAYSGLLVTWYCYNLNTLLQYTGLPAIDTWLLLILVLLLIVESIKKIIKTLLGLLFYNQKIAMLEIIYVTTYVLTVMAAYSLHNRITLYTLFIPMLVYTTGITSILAFIMYKHYTQLSDMPYDADFNINTRITRSRLFGYINQLGHIPFSANMLVPLFGTHFGLSYAALVKIVSTSMQTISSISFKIIGQASEAAFAHAHAYASHEKHALLALANRYVYPTVFYTFITLAAFNYRTIVAHTFTAELDAYTMLTISILLLVLDPLCMTYEKKYLVEEQGHYIALYNASMILLVGIWLYCNCAHPLLCLLSLAGMRIVWYIALSRNHFSVKQN